MPTQNERFDHLFFEEPLVIPQKTLKEGEIVVVMASGWLPMSKEVHDDILNGPSFSEMLEAAAKADKEFKVLPLEEQARITAEREAVYEAERCSQCGCHPQEHGE